MAKKATKKKATKKKATKKKAVRKTSGSRKTSSSKEGALPKVGQRVKWRSISGTSTGHVVAILRKDKTLSGKAYKASAGSPRVHVRSEKTGKDAVHRPGSLKPA